MVLVLRQGAPLQRAGGDPVTLPDDTPELSLIMPFVVCVSEGGPYADDAFVAGVHFGEIKQIVTSPGFNQYEAWVPAALIPQLDLLAMKERLHLRSRPWNLDDHWAFVQIAKLPFTDDEVTP